MAKKKKKKEICTSSACIFMVIANASQKHPSGAPACTTGLFVWGAAQPPWHCKVTDNIYTSFSALGLAGFYKVWQKFRNKPKVGNIWPSSRLWSVESGRCAGAWGAQFLLGAVVCWRPPSTHGLSCLGSSPGDCLGDADASTKVRAPDRLIRCF